MASELTLEATARQRHLDTLETVRRRLWRVLSDNQRLLLMNHTVPPERRVRSSHFLAAGRALERMGLAGGQGYDWGPTHEARQLASWARELGYAQWDGKGWTFTTPDWKRYGRIDPERLAELAAEGLYAAEIARRLDVSRQGVVMAAQRHGLTLPPKPKKPKPLRRDRVLHTEHLAVKLTEVDMEGVRKLATADGLTVSAWVRELVRREIETCRALAHLGSITRPAAARPPGTG